MSPEAFEGPAHRDTGPPPEPAGPPRLPVPRPREIGLGVWAFARVAGRVTGTEAPAVFLTLGRTRRLFWGWLHFAGGLMPGGTLPRRESELVILRVATVRRSAYEFSHHRRLGRRAGVSAEDLSRVVAGPEAEGWTDRERTLLHCTDALLLRDDLDDAEWARLHDELGPRGAVEFLLLVGHYRMLATTLNTLRVPPDAAR